MKRLPWNTPSGRRTVIGLSPDRARPGRFGSRGSRYVMQTHALGLPAARPRSLLFAGLVAAALLVVARRWSR